MDFLKKLLRPWLLIGILIFVFIIYVVTNLLEFGYSIKYALEGGRAWEKGAVEESYGGRKEGVAEKWDGNTNNENMIYEDKDMAKHNGGEYDGTSYAERPEDPDQTALFYQKFKEQKEKDHDEQDEGWQALLMQDHTMFSIDDFEHLLTNCFDYTNRMFEKNIIKYQYEQWFIEPDVDESGAELGTYHWEDAVVGTETVVDTDSDGVFNHVTRENIEGEKVKEGSSVTNKRKFAVHWQDVLALAQLRAWDDSSTWGDLDKETTYDGGYNTPKTNHINDLDNYFLTTADIDEMFNFFAYHFNYYYDACDDYEDAGEGGKPPKEATYEYEVHPGEPDTDFLKTDKAIGYRYLAVRDPDPSDQTLYSPEPPDPPGCFPYTKFIPESAPMSIYNGWENYEYVYQNTDDVPEGAHDTLGWHDAGTPNGKMCVGRFSVVNPAKFMKELSIGAKGAHSYYENESTNEYWVEENGYDWEEETIKHLVMYLDELPLNDSTTPSRSQRVQQLFEMYRSKTIDIKYLGTKIDGVDEKAERLLDDALTGDGGVWDFYYGHYYNHYINNEKSEEEAEALAIEEADKEVELWRENSLAQWEEGLHADYSEASDEYYIIDEGIDLYDLPFYSYGVIFGIPSQGGAYAGGGDDGADGVPPFESNEEIRRTGKFWVADHEGYLADVEANLEAGSQYHFMQHETNYTRGDIQHALDQLAAWASSGSPALEGDKAINSEKSVDAIYNFYLKNNKIDVIGLLAIIRTEGDLGNDHYSKQHAAHWNFFNSGKSSKEGTKSYQTVSTSGTTNKRQWRDFRAEVGDTCIGDALALAMQGWVDNYWLKGQDSYFYMTFGQYGVVYPTDHDSAVAADKNPGYTWPGFGGGHVYCPWWEDRWYADNVSNPAARDDHKLWCNQSAWWYGQLRNAIGNPLTEDTGHASDSDALTDEEIQQLLEWLKENYPWAYEIIKRGVEKLGTKYVYGAGRDGDTSKLDCSSFVAYCFGRSGGTAESLRKSLTDKLPGGRDEVMPGDILYFQGTNSSKPAGTATHIGIVIDPNRKLMIHASSSYGKVVISTYDDNYRRTHFMEAGRAKNRTGR